MSASILNGKQVASAIYSEIKQATAARDAQGIRPPGLAVICLGSDPASIIYVANKRKACEAVGFKSHAYDLPEQTSESELIALIEQLNLTSEIDGILVQLPLPAHIHASAIIERIDPAKDVDGFHPYNLGRLAQGNPFLRPCTPYGIIELLKFYGLNLAGEHAVVIGASNIVGRPMALELLMAKATVTVCHRLTKNLADHVRMASLVVVAAGTLNVISPDWLHHEQIIVDVGIHRQKNGSLRGDVDFINAKEKVRWITPVPGGVGPMTICTLLTNTLKASNQSSPS